MSDLAEARDLLRQAYIWADTRGEPPKHAVETVAHALAHARAKAANLAIKYSAKIADDVAEKKEYAQSISEDRFLKGLFESSAATARNISALIRQKGLTL